MTQGQRRDNTWKCTRISKVGAKIPGLCTHKVVKNGTVKFLGSGFPISVQ